MANLKEIKISAIAAMASNRVIGTDNKLPWHIPEDLKFFKEKTLGKIVIMGRKTFDSVGAKPMPKRLNVIVTRQKDYTANGARMFFDTHGDQRGLTSLSPAVQKALQDLRTSNFEPKGFYVFNSIEAAVEFSKAVVSETDRWSNEIMICGGEEIYRLAMPYTDRIYLTVIDQEFEGDAKFPQFDHEKYRLIETSRRTEPVVFSFRTYEK